MTARQLAPHFANLPYQITNLNVHSLSITNMFVLKICSGVF